MATRQVTATGKDRDGDITKLCGSFGSRSKLDAISDITNGVHVYKSGTSIVEVVENPTVKDGMYLRTKADGSTGNNLDELKDC